jgi:hypothetical protein
LPALVDVTAVLDRVVEGRSSIVFDCVVEAFVASDVSPEAADVTDDESDDDAPSSLQETLHSDSNATSPAVRRAITPPIMSARSTGGAARAHKQLVSTSHERGMQ